MCVRRICCCLYPIVFAIFVVIVWVAIIFNQGNTFTSCLVSCLVLWENCIVGCGWPVLYNLRKGRLFCMLEIMAVVKWSLFLKLNILTLPKVDLSLFLMFSLFSLALTKIDLQAKLSRVWFGPWILYCNDHESFTPWLPSECYYACLHNLQLQITIMIK